MVNQPLLDCPTLVRTLNFHVSLLSPLVVSPPATIYMYVVQLSYAFTRSACSHYGNTAGDDRGKDKVESK